MSYQFQEFPKWKYHLVKEAVCISSKDEEDALGTEWVDNPGQLKAEEAKELFKEEPSPAKKRGPRAKS